MDLPQDKSLGANEFTKAQVQVLELSSDIKLWIAKCPEILAV
jgi:hypothetical protein